MWSITESILNFIINITVIGMALTLFIGVFLLLVICVFNVWPFRTKGEK